MVGNNHTNERWWRLYQLSLKENVGCANATKSFVKFDLYFEPENTSFSMNNTKLQSYIVKFTLDILKPFIKLLYLWKFVLQYDVL